MSEAYDRDKLVELFGGDPATLAEVEREFFDTARDAAREIAATGDLATIARAAHRLKGASGMIGAAPLREIAEAVERAAKADDLDWNDLRYFLAAARAKTLAGAARSLGVEHSTIGRRLTASRSTPRCYQRNAVRAAAVPSCPNTSAAVSADRYGMFTRCDASPAPAVSTWTDAM